MHILNIIGTGSQCREFRSDTQRNAAMIADIIETATTRFRDMLSI